MLSLHENSCGDSHTWGDVDKSNWYYVLEGREDESLCISYSYYAANLACTVACYFNGSA